MNGTFEERYYDSEDGDNSFTIVNGKLTIEHEHLSEWSTITVSRNDDGYLKLHVTIVDGDAIGAPPYDLLISRNDDGSFATTKGDGKPFMNTRGQFERETNYGELQEYNEFPEPE